jgi:hypothetical protein
VSAEAEGPRYKLTIGELFPATDLVAQWVFCVTALSEDIMVLTDPLQTAVRRGDLREMLAYYRLLVTRLYEGRRLVLALEDYPDVSEFAAPLMPTPSGVDLRDVYVRESEDKPPVIEEMYAQIRHRTVHYMRVGSRELRRELARHARFPAQVAFFSTGAERTIHYQWVQAVSGMQVFGDVDDEHFLQLMRERADLAAAVVAAWMYVSGLAVILNANRLGIDTARFGDPPQPDAPT